MKDKFFKFFEIGKLDKGLFRIWIVLLPIFLFAMSVDLFTSSNYKEHQDIKNYICLNIDGKWRAVGYKTEVKNLISSFPKFKTSKLLKPPILSGIVVN